MPTAKVTPPRWLKPMNRVFVGLQRTGLKLGGMYLLTVPGRKSGKPRTTPISLMEHEGGRYVVGGFPGADWVRNASAAKAGTLTCGRRHERVLLVELPVEQARPILRAFPAKVPSGVSMMTSAGIVESGSPDEFEALAGRCAVFRIDPSPA
ncbi:nitroreductase family deazaflavin-dependent oxidoreductase [Amycolatopsis magusensis]|uniref:Deazaflavin-dependent oxidoreductase (Nitroreductase family) n=1 Tax=Amycolatopsis magusensis TaxID=882444 RepID=A0ABS4Q4X1_9PSEU|nr:nitroreductase family deazaflavin-dependent oxidoreductase [Amycolatopsis magusensis]MBP2186170.1 deazaflavin-dependent oxidoreductase (nitroreductase family) [Amycolatopsis magusensis]MDI5976657.1 nitroreductase family deazaflavin-dependent oxidoreductase [Amycolatopsis magusensis]